MIELEPELSRQDLWLHRGTNEWGVFEKAPVGLEVEQGQQRVERAAAVADESDVDGVSEADPRGIELDLHRARLAGLGHELDIRERRADHEERVALLESFLGRPRAQEPDRARGEGTVVRHRGLSE